MIRTLIINGASAEWELDAGSLRYRRGAGEFASAYSIQPVSSGRFSVLLGDRSFDVTLNRGEVWVQGRRFEIDIFDPRDRREASVASSAGGAQRVTSPMPGKIIRVLVALGDEVSEGQGLVVVEAMKMQNEMKSPKSGRVTEVRATAELSVKAGEVLVVVE